LTIKYCFASPKALNGISLQGVIYRIWQSAKKGGVFPRTRAKISVKTYIKETKKLIS